MKRWRCARPLESIPGAAGLVPSDNEGEDCVPKFGAALVLPCAAARPAWNATAAAAVTTLLAGIHRHCVGAAEAAELFFWAWESTNQAVNYAI